MSDGNYVVLFPCRLDPVRGYYAYTEVWTPTAGEAKDQFAVAVIKDEEIVGDVPFNLSSTVSQFLRRPHNIAFAEVTSHYVNQGAGYSLEIPCIYKFFGPEPYISYKRY